MPAPLMIDREAIIEKFHVQPGKKFRLKDYDPGWSGDGDIPKAKRKELAEQVLTQDVSALADAQVMLYADDSWSLLVIFQAMDAAGKDSTIKHVMSGINPQGCQVYSFKHPSSEELDHNFLWRSYKALPERGRIGIFNRSYYEEVLIVKVHPEILAAQRIPEALADDSKFWDHRYEDINYFERHLTRNGTAIVKFFLHVSKEEQRERPSIGSSTRATSRSANAGTITCGLTRIASAKRAPGGRRGTSFPPITNGSAGRWSPPFLPRRSNRSA
jgi:PPK2 family polyphosphate:nucleotide phosphotransferase